ncbi:MAG: DEAD/DEAH box helicase [Synergistaceae bacterium]|nr:DEAD/DEAH box helicase [Synergistaceae bacterium]
MWDVLERYREEHPTDPHALRARGTWFEELCRWWLRHDPIQRQRFSDVWLWSEWPGHVGQDTGIDIVAKIRGPEGGPDRFCAIQCKFYDPDTRVDQSDIDTFLAASGKHGFVQRMFISTADAWTVNAEREIQDQQIPCSRIGIEQMDESGLDWDEFYRTRPDKAVWLPTREALPHQKAAIEAVVAGLSKDDRGKLIMACGTGKTFTSLKIAERMAGPGEAVLFLVPSIALLDQALLAWNADHARDMPMISFAVCSDASVGRRRSDDEDMSPLDLACPPTTRGIDLARAWRDIPDEERAASMTVVFATYQSLKVVKDAQALGFPSFALAICDEAHRTTGVTLKSAERSAFLMIHDEDQIHAAKRLYMTATPRLYKASAVRKAEEAGAELCSMDDPDIYGPELHRLSFSKAVEQELLSDYKVMILAVDEAWTSTTLHDALKDGTMDLNDASKIFGCWRGLSKQILSADRELLFADMTPMRSAVAFSRTIEDSKAFCDDFKEVMAKTVAKEGLTHCALDHVDGKSPMPERNSKIRWLKGDAPREGQGEGMCRILSNARCLSEGVDVPALDAVLFLDPRKSDVDIVQSVGRVMRKVDGKKFGYIILPIVAPADVPPEEALDDDETYKVVWQVLQALRAHDDKFDAEVSSLHLNERASKIIIDRIGKESGDPGGDGIDPPRLLFPPEAWRAELQVRIVKKCGDRRYWNKWASDMAKVAEAHSLRLQAALASGGRVRAAFDAYLAGLRAIINASISEEEAVGMLSQHLITKPIFDAAFAGFSDGDPVSRAMEGVLRELEEEGLESETKSLGELYEDVKKKFAVVEKDAGRQKVIKDLYEKFFKTAFPTMADRLGIVYTPDEVVEFILRSADWALRHELGIEAGLSAPGVHVLDPFTGTGTFLARLISMGLIDDGALERKYLHELWANEILLLPYYIAAVNVEAAYHARTGGALVPFPGIVLTDTFAMSDAAGTLPLGFQEEGARAQAQRETPITVIVGNPPYSVGQGSANDDARNLRYPTLDERIRETYAAKSNAALKRNLYDSYIRAIRWASDRIGERGVICYVTNGSFLRGNNADGLRKCLYEEFHSIYVFDLRGNANTQGEIRRRESGNVFGAGSRLPVAITLLVKDPARAGEPCKIHYRDIGDDLKREAKLSIIAQAGSFGGLASAGKMEPIIPNDEGDWLAQRSGIFDTFLRLGNKKELDRLAIFRQMYSTGISSGRDAWCYNFSREALARNMASMIDVYNEERTRWHASEEDVFVKEGRKDPGLRHAGSEADLVDPRAVQRRGPGEGALFRRRVHPPLAVSSLREAVAVLRSTSE